MSFSLEKKRFRYFAIFRTERSLVLESFFCLIIAYLALKVLTWEKLMPMLGKLNEESPKEHQPQNTELIKRIKAAMIRAHSFLPLVSKCFIMAIAVRLILNRRKIKSTIYIGFKKGNEEFQGHAWIRSADLFLAGGRERLDYKIIAFYS